MKNTIYFNQEGYQKRRARFALKLFFVILAIGLLVGLPYLAFSRDSVSADATQLDNFDPVIRLVNLERKKASLGYLRYNVQLEDAAKAKAEDMLKNQYFDHYRPADKRSPWDFIEGAGYNYRKAGENLAIDFTSVDGAFGAWMQSDLHKKNILDGDFTETGVGYVVGEFEGHKALVVVQMFGKPTNVVFGKVLGSQD